MVTSKLQQRRNSEGLLAERIRQRIAVISLVILVAVISAELLACNRAAPGFRLDLQFPNGSREMHLLTVGHRNTSGSPQISAGTGPQGPWTRMSEVVSEFEVLSIRNNSVDFRFRLKSFSRLLNSGEAMGMLDAEKMPWQTITYAPGQLVSISVESGDPVLLSGSVVYQ